MLQLGNVITGTVLRRHPGVVSCSLGNRRKSIQPLDLASLSPQLPGILPGGDASLDTNKRQDKACPVLHPCPYLVSPPPLTLIISDSSFSRSSSRRACGCEDARRVQKTEEAEMSFNISVSCASTHADHIICAPASLFLIPGRSNPHA